jgi:hypothetical protein
MADIHRIDAPGAAREQDVGEPAGRGADIERDRSRRIDGEALERVSQLEAAARYPGMIETANFKRLTLDDGSVRCVETARTAEDEAAANERLSPRAARSKATRDQDNVKAAGGVAGLGSVGGRG